MATFLPMLRKIQIFRKHAGYETLNGKFSSTLFCGQSGKWIKAAKILNRCSPGLIISHAPTISSLSSNLFSSPRRKFEVPVTSLWSKFWRRLEHIFMASSQPKLFTSIFGFFRVGHKLVGRGSCLDLLRPWHSPWPKYDRFKTYPQKKMLENSFEGC